MICHFLTWTDVTEGATGYRGKLGCKSFSCFMRWLPDLSVPRLNPKSLSRPTATLLSRLTHRGSFSPRIRGLFCGVNVTLRGQNSSVKSERGIAPGEGGADWVGWLLRRRPMEATVWSRGHAILTAACLSTVLRVMRPQHKVRRSAKNVQTATRTESRNVGLKPRIGLNHG